MYISALKLSRLFHDYAQILELRKRKMPSDRTLVSQTLFSSILADPVRQQELASSLMMAMNIPKGLSSYGIEWLEQCQQYYDEHWPGLYRIVVVEPPLLLDEPPLVAWKSVEIGRPFEVALLFQNNHFGALKSIRRFFRLDNFCVDCEVPYFRQVNHNVKWTVIKKFFFAFTKKYAYVCRRDATIVQKLDMGDVLRSRISEKRAKNASGNFEMPIALNIINVSLANFIEMPAM